MLEKMTKMAYKEAKAESDIVFQNAVIEKERQFVFIYLILVFFYYFLCLIIVQVSKGTTSGS